MATTQLLLRESGGSHSPSWRGPVPARTRGAIETIQQSLDGHADARTRRWWEQYLRGAAPFRGVKMADVRRVVHTWNREAGSSFTPSAKKELALALLRQESTEDKLSGMLLLQEVLLPAGDLGQRDVARFASLFRDGALGDWNVCDWFCVKVLGPLVEREGARCARTIADWRASTNLWQRRAAGVAFVNLAKRGDENFTGFTTLLLRVCDATLRHSDRFAQTGAGWVLRELSRAEPARVAEFIGKRLEHFSAEALRQATARLDRDEARDLRARRAERLRPARTERGRRWKAKSGRSRRRSAHS